MLSLPLRPRHLATALALIAVGACVRQERPPEAVVLAPVYCYRTLADVSCYTDPDPGRGVTFLGVYLRDPHDPGWPDYWLRRAGAWP